MVMQYHKVGNFMVKEIILDLDLENGLKGLRIKLLISWVSSQLHTLGVQVIRCAYVVTRTVPSQPMHTLGVQLRTLGVLS